MVTNQKRQQQSLIMSSSGQNKEIFFSLMRQVGTHGRYQLALFATLCFVAVLSGGVTLITPFLFYQGNYHCKNELSSQQCLDYICRLSPKDRSSYGPDADIYSFANKFGNYQCPQQQATLNLMKTFFYSGQLFGFFLSSLIGDLVRIKLLMLGGLTTTIVGTLLLTLTNQIWMGVVGMFLALAGMIMSLNLTYVFVTELVEEKNRQKYKVILTALFSLGGLTNVLWFYLLPNFEIVLLVFFGGPTLVLTIIFAIFFKDTPISLITKHNPEKAYENLMYIAKVNRKTEIGLTLEEVRQTQQKYKQQYLQSSKNDKTHKKFSFLDLFLYKSLRTMTIYLAFLDCVFALQYLTPTLMLNRFNFSIYVNGAAIQSAQIFAGLIPYFTINKVKRRIEGMLSFTVIMVCAIVLIFIWDQGETHNNNIGSNIAVLIFMFFIVLTVSSAFNFYSVYLNQLFPSQVRIIGVGFTKSWGSMTSMASAQIITACLDSGFKIMLLFAILAAICIVLSYLLPQTYGKRPPEVIQELEKDEVEEGQGKYENIVEQVNS